MNFSTSPFNSQLLRLRFTSHVRSTLRSDKFLRLIAAGVPLLFNDFHTAAEAAQTGGHPHQQQSRDRLKNRFERRTPDARMNSLRFFLTVTDGGVGEVRLVPTGAQPQSQPQHEDDADLPPA